MSQNKTGQSNWSAKQKQEYWERRKKGLRGQVGYINLHKRVKEKKDNEQLMPVGYAKGFLSSRLQGGSNSKAQSDPSFTKAAPGIRTQRLQAKSNGRGE